MPTDRAGKKIHVGDIVNVRCLVTGVDRHPDFINVALEVTEPEYPGAAKRTLLMNALQTELVESLGETNTDIDIDSAFADRQKE